MSTQLHVYAPRLRNDKRPITSARNTRNTIGKNVSSRLVDAQKTGLRTDVTFTFEGSSEEVKAHKLILALGSPVFDTMFYGEPWLTENKVHLADVEPHVFKLLIEFLYTDKLAYCMPIQTAIQVLYVATKYCVDHLKGAIEQYLKDSITLETVIPILKTSILFQCRELEAKCWDCVEMDTDRVVFTEEFLSIDRDLLVEILNRESLVISEIKLFEAVLRWADKQCKRQGITSVPSNIQLILGDSLKKIRFPVMDPTEFANGPATSGLLSQEEISNALLTKFSTVDKPRPIFSPQKRTPKKQISRLDCKCRSIKAPTPCSFCLDRDISAQTVSEGKSSIFWQIPTLYCSCRTRDYCPCRRIF